MRQILPAYKVKKRETLLIKPASLKSATGYVCCFYLRKGKDQIHLESNLNKLSLALSVLDELYTPSDLLHAANALFNDEACGEMDLINKTFSQEAINLALVEHLVKEKKEGRKKIQGHGKCSPVQDIKGLKTAYVNFLWHEISGERCSPSAAFNSTLAQIETTLGDELSDKYKASNQTFSWVETMLVTCHHINSCTDNALADREPDLDFDGVDGVGPFIAAYVRDELEPMHQVDESLDPMATPPFL